MSSNYFNPFFTVKCMDGLFISNQTATKDQQFLANNKFGLIVNTCPLEFKVPPIPNIYKVMNFHWQNSRGTMIDVIDIKGFKGIFDEISKGLEEGSGVLVVSDRGHSRAITFVLLFLMWKFGWELFKALQYINSKRENLQVRAAYLKLLVNYEKGQKGNNESINNSEQKNLNKSQHSKNTQSLSKHLTSHQIKQSIRPSQQKWSQSRIKSPQQQLLSNTFKNTIKKRKINELNQQYREVIAKEEKKLQGSHKNNTTSKEWNRKSSHNGNGMYGDNRQKTKKSVKFSNQIQIIIKQSAVTQIFPQYQQLSAQHLIQHQRQCCTSKQQHVDSIHSHQSPQPCTYQANSSKGFNVQRTSDARNTQTSPSRKKETTVPGLTNGRMINIRKMERVGSGLTGNSTSGNSSSNYNQRNNYQNEFILLNSSQDSYSNEFYQPEENISSNHRNDMAKSNNLIESSNSSSLKNKQKREQYFLKQPFTKTQAKLKQQSSSTTKPNQTSTNFKTQQLLNYQIRPSSLKKFKHIFIEQKPPKASPKKKQRKDDRILTQPKYDHEFDNPTLEEDLTRGENYKRRFSGSQNDDNHGDKLYHHKKSASTTMAMKMMNRFQKKASTPIKNEKRCPTPQIITGDTQKQMRSSSHNNFFTRPLSRGGSNSLKMATKKSATSSIEEQGLNRQKPSPAVFNVNINVNIGKLQMFGTKNMDSREPMSRSSVNQGATGIFNNNKQKLTKAQSHIDKSQLLYNRIRSSSSNDNYSKFSVSSTSIAERQDPKVEKITKDRFMGKEGFRVSQDREHSHHERVELIPSEGFGGHSALINEDENIFASESFSKKDIMEKINRKLLNKSRNSRLQEHSKKTSILENNFV